MGPFSLYHGTWVLSLVFHPQQSLSKLHVTSPLTGDAGHSVGELPYEADLLAFPDVADGRGQKYDAELMN
jgi:hypothetical protein